MKPAKNSQVDGGPDVNPIWIFIRMCEEEPVSLVARLSAISICALVASSAVAAAQGLDVKRYNPSEWTKGRFSEVVTVNGPGKTIYLAGIGAEDETGPAGASAPILHSGNPYEQCKYAYDKIKRLLAAHGASLADAVKQVVYVTDVRYQAEVAKCRREAYGDGPIPANTFLVINALAIPGMLLEIDVTAVVGSK
jgi:enamine deaminase RidA (YjgF/YER057c/UK114 family)